MRDGRYDTNGTLNRLNRALENLEGRLAGRGPRSAAGYDDVSLIKARQAELRGSGSRFPKPTSRGLVSADHDSSLRNEIRQLRREMQGRLNAQQPSPGRRAPHAKRRAPLQQADAQSLLSTKQMLADIALLKNEISQLAREKSMQDLLERSGQLETHIQNLPSALSANEDLSLITARLESLQDHLGQLPQDTRVSAVENQVRQLTASVEQLANHLVNTEQPAQEINTRLADLADTVTALQSNLSASDQGLPNALERIEARIANVQDALDRDDANGVSERQASLFTNLSDRLDVLQQETSNLRAETHNTSTQTSIDALAQRLDSLANYLEQAPNSSSPDDAFFSELNERLNFLQNETSNIRAEARQTSSQESIDAIAARIDELSNRIDNAPMHPGSADGSAFAEFNDRLTHMTDKITRVEELSAQAHETLIPTLDQRLSELNEQLGRGGSGQPDMSHLERRLDEIASMLAGEPSSGGAGSIQLQTLEEQVAHLAQAINGSGAVIDHDSILSAARTAAEEAVSRLGQSALTPDDAAIRQLADDLKSLETLARDSDDRNTQTFTAIQDALLKVVDHISALEQRLADNPPQPQQAPVQPTPPRQSVDAPALSPEELDTITEAPVLDDGHRIIPESTGLAREAMSPGQAAAAAAAAALEEEKGSVEVDADTGDTQQSLLRNMANRLRRGAKADVANEPGDDLGSGAVTVSDEPIEPGSGRADLGDIMRRVRQERASIQDGAPSTDEDHGKSDFIAAARRAARAAAEEATVSSRRSGGGKADGGGGIVSKFAKHRKPILLGAGAILLALLAIPAFGNLFGSNEQQSSLNAQAPQEQSVLDTDPQIEAADAPEAIDETLEAIVAENDASPVIRDVTEMPELPELDRSVETALSGLPSEPVQAETVSANLTFTLADVPQEVGPIALREAAASGDAKAVYLVGDYYFGGVSGQSGADLDKALEWYEKSAEMGYAPAQYRVGNFYEKGFGGTRDLGQARKWYELAAGQGNAAAMHNLAVLLANGPEGERDLDLATSWFKQAADLGVKDSQFNLAILSAQGNGIPQNLSESYKWFALAGESGDQDAIDKRDQVAQALSPAQLEAAKAATEAWAPQEMNEDVNIVSIPDEWTTDVEQTTAAGPPPELSAEEMKQAVSNIQGILNMNGFDAGPIDGVMGNKTREAIKAFQAANGMEANGEVTPDLVRKLLELAEQNQAG